MVWCFVKSLVLLVVVEYRAYVQFLREALKVLLVLEYAMTRLITLCPDTKLLQEEDRLAPEEELRVKLKEELLPKEEQAGPSSEVIGEEELDVARGSCSDESSDEFRGVKRCHVRDEFEGRHEEPSQDDEENEVNGGKITLSENEEKEEKETDREESDMEKVTVMMMGVKVDDIKESEEDSMETANSHPSSSSSSSPSFQSVKEESIHVVPSEEEEKEEEEEETASTAAGQIGNLIKELFGEEWGEDDVLNYLSEEEQRENRSAAEMEWISFLQELEDRVGDGGGGGDDGGDRETKEKYEDDGDKKTSEICDGDKENDERDSDFDSHANDKEVDVIGIDRGCNGKNRKNTGNLVKSFSLEMVDCDYIDQSESESEAVEKVIKERLTCDSVINNSDDSFLDMNMAVIKDDLDGSDLVLKKAFQNRSDITNIRSGMTNQVTKTSISDENCHRLVKRHEKYSVKVDSFLNFLPDERSFLGGESKKKMPKSLQKIQKEEEKLINWNIYEESKKQVTESIIKEERNNGNVTVQTSKDKENIHDVSAKDYARVYDAKRKRSLSVHSNSENDRKRIASGEGNPTILDNDVSRDRILSDGNDTNDIRNGIGNAVDFEDDSVFGDSDDDSDGDGCPNTINKRVKIESFSSAVSNILEEIGLNNTSIDLDDLADFDEDVTVKVEENDEKNHEKGFDENASLEKLNTDGEIVDGNVYDEGNVNKNQLHCEKELPGEIKDEREDSVSPINKVTSINRPQPLNQQKPGTDINVDIDASLKWIKEFPPPLEGPQCTCKSPGTPPWKLASDFAMSPSSAKIMHDASCRLTLDSSLEHELVSVKMRRPRCSSFSPEMTSSPYQKQYSQSGIGMYHEETESLCPRRKSSDGSDCSREQKDKRRLLRSLSFFSRSSQSNLSMGNGIQSSPSPSDAYSKANPIYGSSFTSFATPRRWSRILGCRRRNVQSCIFPNSPSFSSTNGTLPSRVRSEPNVTEKWRNMGDNDSVQRRFSKVWHEKRRAVRSCIFPDPEDEDLMPYGGVESKIEDRSRDGDQGDLRKSRDFEEALMSTSHLSIQESECSSRTPESLVRTESSDWDESVSDVREPKLTHSKSETPLTDIIHSVNESQSQPKKSISFNHRPKSLVFIPESRMKTYAYEKTTPRTPIKRPKSLVIPPDIQIPKRDPSLTPPDPSQTRPRSQSRLSYRDLRILRRQPSAEGKALYPVLTPSPTSHSRIWERDMSQFQKERRKNVRSWSFSPTPASIPLRVSRNPSEKWPDVTSFEQDHLVLQPRKLLADHSSAACSSVFDTVIFPWRRGDPNRSSGRSSPAPSDAVNQSPTPSPYYNQSPVPEESVNGGCEVAHDSRQKDSSVWRRSRVGSGGVSRSTRKEKASSSPVFRRASLSHSEWDIRRPWSHVYSEREAAKLSQSVCRLAMTSAEEGVVAEGAREGEEGPRSLPYMPSSNHSSSEGVFQKFKKSLSLRLAKKGSRSESPSSHSAPVSQCPPEPSTQVESQTLPRRRGSINREDDNKSSFLFGHPLFRSSKERRRARLKDARSSKCNSGDSGDSGIELVTGSGHVTTSLDMTSHPADVDANNYLDPSFVASFADDGSGPRELNPRAVRRTHSDVGGVAGRGSLHYSRQLSTPQPIKLRPAHRLPQHTGSLGKSKSSLKRSKASSHLRRSISQPLDLDKAYDTPISTLRKCRSPSNAQNRRQRRPSAGNILNDDNTTSEDEIGMSDSEEFRTDLKRSLEEDEDMIVYAEALWDHVTLDSEELVFKAGDLITVIDSSDKDWWWGRICHRAGWFPAAFVRLLVNQEDHQDTSSHDTRTSGPARKQSISGLSNDQIRTNVINEIISTERDFVKHLRDVVEGYLRQVRKRPDMFNDEKISSIFGNMEALYQFQSNFLKELEMCIDWKDPHKSCIGAAFIRNREKFEIYSEYCNNHPSAVSSLQELYQDQKYIHFFEACRLLQEMIDISLDGFLLTPVQKICKYPLQLQELLKYTKVDHPDYTSVQGALEAMRDVALLVNERKRRMECLEKIASWQITVEGWEGPELLEDSSQLIYQGDVTKGVGGSWPKEVSLFLFDHQLVYCKRDLLKRNTFVYRGRLNLDMCEIVDLPDGKDSSLNINAHNTWKIRSLEKNKWYVFSCKMASEKQKWMEAFRRERELVAADESAGFVVAEKAKHLAKVAARNQRNRPKRPRTTKSHKRVQAMTYAQAELLVNVDPEMRSNSLPSGVQPPEGKKKGLWFSFGGHKKGRGSGRTLSQIQHHPV